MIGRGFRVPQIAAGAPLVGDVYAVNALSPELVADFVSGTYRKASAPVSFAELLDFSRASGATMVSQSGTPVWAAHNLHPYSEDGDHGSYSFTFTGDAGPAPDPRGGNTATLLRETADNQQHLYYNACNIGTSGVPYIGGFVVKKGTGSTAPDWIQMIWRSGAHNGSQAWRNFNISTGTVGSNGGSAIDDAGVVNLGNGYFFIWTRATSNNVSATAGPYLGFCNNQDHALRLPPYAGATTSDVIVWAATCYRADLGGAADNPDAEDWQTGAARAYVPTPSASAVFKRRADHHRWDGGAWVPAGLLLESESRTNILPQSAIPPSQNINVAAVPHTLHFTGTGTISLSGAASAGPLAGTGEGEANRVSLTFTPAAGSLSLAVSGQVRNAQLEVGQVASSYIPTASVAVTRLADTVSIAGARTPFNATAMSIQAKARCAYADEDAVGQIALLKWQADANNQILWRLDTDGSATGEACFAQTAGGLGALVASTGVSLSPGPSVAVNLAARHTSSVLNAAVAGAVLSEDTSPTSLPALGAIGLSIGSEGFFGTVELLRMWSIDITDNGLAAASS